MMIAPYVWFGGKGKVAPVIWQRLGNVPNFVWSTCENDLFMLQCGNEYETLGNIHTKRSTLKPSALCGCDFSRESALPRAYITGGYWWENTSGLLDTFTDSGKDKTHLSSSRGRIRRWLAGSRASLDCDLSRNNKINQPNGWRRRHAGLCSNTRITCEVVRNAFWCSVSTGTDRRHAWTGAHTGGERKNPCRFGWSSDARQYEEKAVRVPQGKSDYRRTTKTNECGKARNHSKGRIPTEATRFTSRKAHLGCRNRARISVNQSNGEVPWGYQRGNMVRTAKQFPVQGFPPQTIVVVHSSQVIHTRGRANRERETIWFSPYCLMPETQLTLWGANGHGSHMPEVWADESGE